MSYVLQNKKKVIQFWKDMSLSKWCKIFILRWTIPFSVWKYIHTRMWCIKHAKNKAKYTHTSYSASLHKWSSMRPMPFFWSSKEAVRKDKNVKRRVFVCLFCGKESRCCTGGSLSWQAFCKIGGVLIRNTHKAVTSSAAHNHFP